MKLNNRLFLGILILSSLAGKAQKITLEDIWKKGTFSLSYMPRFRPIGSNNYTLLNHDQQKNSKLERYSYKTLQKQETILTSQQLKLPYISNYYFSKNEDKVLLVTGYEQIFRHSYRANYHLYDLETKTLQSISQHKIQAPELNKKGDKIAYVFKNNLYVQNLNSGNTKQITQDGLKNNIINGVTDWVYEEEFGFVRAFEWNRTGTKIAFLRFDESEVPVFSMDVMGRALYPQQTTFKYPKAGEQNAKVTLHIYDTRTGKTKKNSLGRLLLYP